MSFKHVRLPWFAGVVIGLAEGYIMITDHSGENDRVECSAVGKDNDFVVKDSFGDTAFEDSKTLSIPSQPRIRASSRISN
jgi:hypothetical protein